MVNLLVSIVFNFRIIFSNVDLSATMQSRICIVGENGAGKTTLLKIIMEMNEPTKGYRTAHRNLKFGYFTQVKVIFNYLKICISLGVIAFC